MKRAILCAVLIVSCAWAFMSCRVFIYGQNVEDEGQRNGIAAPQVTGDYVTLIGGVATTDNPRPRWRWNAVDLASVYRYGFSEGGWIAQSAAATEFTPAGNLGDGAHTLYVQAGTSDGLWSASGSFTIAVTTHPPAAPVVQGLTPTTDTTPTWIWAAVSGAAGYRFGYTEGTWIATSAALSFTPSAPLSEGPHTLYVQATNGLGLWSASGSHAIVIGPTSPVLVITGPLSGAEVDGSSLITFTDSGQAAPEVSVDDVNWTPAVSGATRLDDIPEFAGLPEGSFSLYLRDVGAAGIAVEAGIIKRTQGSGSITINLITPTDADISLNGNDLILDKKVPESLVVTAVLAGASAYAWYLDGVLLAATGNTVTISSSAHDPGPYTLALIVTKNGVPYSAELDFSIVN